MRNPNYYILISGLGAALAGGSLSGCSYYHARQTGRTTTQVADDKRISERVYSSLKTSPVFKFPEVGVKTFDRVVQLNGFVQTEEQKRAAQEIAYRSAAYENAALLLGVLIRSGSDTQDVEVGLPVLESSRLQGHLPRSVLEELIAEGFDTDPRAAVGLAVTALTELTADRRVPWPRRPAPDPSVTFGTRLMLIAPHSPSPS